MLCSPLGRYGGPTVVMLRCIGVDIAWTKLNIRNAEILNSKRLDELLESSREGRERGAK